MLAIEHQLYYSQKKHCGDWNILIEQSASHVFEEWNHMISSFKKLIFVKQLVGMVRAATFQIGIAQWHSCIVHAEEAVVIAL